MGEAYVPTEQPETSEASRLPSPHVHPGGASDRQGTAAQGAQSPVGLIWRVRDRRTFASLRQARRVRSGPVTVAWVDDGSVPPRVAYAVGRRTGPAVRRNRVRRQLRAIVARNSTDLAPGAYLVGMASAQPHPSLELEGHLRRGLERVGAASGGSWSSPVERPGSTSPS